MQIFTLLSLFILGTIFGSFLNACIYRLPRGLSLREPEHSFCPRCKKQLRWYQLIPLLSYIGLGGRCTYCHKQIPFRYFVVEALAGLLFLAIPLHGPLPLQGLLVLELLLLLGIFFSDLETQVIPDEFSIPGIALGLIYSFLKHGAYGLQKGLLGAALAGGLFWAIAMVGKFIYKKEALGGGDIKLVILLGSLLWPLKTLLMLYLAFFIGSISAVALLLLKKKGRKDYIPFGPSIVLAGIIVLLWGEPLIKIVFPYL